MATDHTCGAPPNRGSTILVNIGCTANMSAALRKMAPVRAASISRSEEGDGAAASRAESGPVAGGFATVGLPATERLLVAPGRLRLPNRVLMRRLYRLWGARAQRRDPEILPQGFFGPRSRTDRMVHGSAWAACCSNSHAAMRRLPPTTERSRSSPISNMARAFESNRSFMTARAYPLFDTE